MEKLDAPDAIDACKAEKGEKGDVTWKRLASNNAQAAVVLIRFMVGAVFLSEGLQKFLFPDRLGAGRFLKIGLPMPELLGPFVGTFEIVCGAWSCWACRRVSPWLAAIPRSVNSSATSLLRIGAPRSAWIVNWFGAIACFVQVASIRRSASRALSWAATTSRRRTD